jgi:hypothetical protein
MNLQQVRHRIPYELKKRILKRIDVIPASLSNQEAGGVVYYRLLTDEYKEYYAVSEDNLQNILNNSFSFLNGLKYQFEKQIIWDIDPFAYRLWIFYLNYFDYLLDLLNGYEFYYREEYVSKGYELITLWIEKNLNCYDPNIWDPYVVSKRVINWIIFYSLTKQHVNNNQTILDAINTHAHFLHKNIEYYLGANHVVMNGKALIFCGIFLDEEKFLKKGLKILEEEYKEQVLSDGGHYERSFSYHVEVLMHFLEISVLLLNNGRRIEANQWIEKIKPMFEYLYNIMMPNGAIPLVNDSVLDYPILANDLLECGAILYNESKYKRYGKKYLSLYGFRLFGEEGFKKYQILNNCTSSIIKSVVNRETGYYIIKDCLDAGELYFLFDCGDGGPDYNLGHTHADALNIILTIGQHEIFTDSGTYTYKHCKERDYYRSTEAHNTICIDKVSSSRIWKAFRVAERSKTKVIKYEDTELYTLICAEHNGYTKVLGHDKIIHRRYVCYLKKNAIIVIDNLHGKIENTHELRLLYHVPNNKKLKMINTSIIAITDNIRVFFDSPYQIENALVSKLFNTQENANKVIVEKQFSDNVNLITVIQFNQCNIKIEKENGYITIIIGQKKIDFNLKNVLIDVREIK